MIIKIRHQGKLHKIFFIIFALVTLFIMFYYLSNTIIYFTTPRQFPINSFIRFPLTLLIFPAEIFSFLFAFYFVYCLLYEKKRTIPKPLDNKEKIGVAVLIPVYNEPKEIIERTLKACSKLEWPGKVKIYLLDDSTSPENKKEAKELSAKYGTLLIKRTSRKGYKAGNINNAIKSHVSEDYFVILDSDQAPEPEFLDRTMDHFSDENIAFVQTPQHFIEEKTAIERAAKIGTNIFYRAQCQKKAEDGAVPFCGTNAVFNKSKFKEAGGFSYYTATEDIELGIRINELGYKGIYVPEILVHGFAPKDFKSYSSQQYRWANGNLAILRESWLKLLKGNFPLRYQIHMFFTTGWWIIGVVSLLYIIVPIFALVFGLGTHHTWLPNSILSFIFLHVVLGVGMIYVSLDNRIEKEKITLKDAFLQYSLIVNSMFIYTRAAINSLIFKRYIGFVRTNKRGSSAGISLIKWNLALACLCLVLSLYALYNAVISSDFVGFRTYFPISAWLLFYSVVLFSSILFVGGNEYE